MKKQTKQKREPIKRRAMKRNHRTNTVQLQLEERKEPKDVTNQPKKEPKKNPKKRRRNHGERRPFLKTGAVLPTNVKTRAATF